MNLTVKPFWRVCLFTCLVSGIVHAEGNQVTIRKLTLQDACKQVLETDQSLRIALLEIRKSDLAPWSALTKMTPRVSASGDYSNTESSSRTPPGTSDREDGYSGSVTVRQPLLDFTVFPAYRLAGLTREITRLNQHFDEREVLFGVTRSFYEVLKQERLLKLQKTSLDLAQKQLDQAGIRYEVGSTPRLDVLRARSEVENTRRTLIETDLALQLARNTLRNILNEKEHVQLELIEPDAMQFDDESFGSMLARAYEHREDLASASLAIDQEKTRKQSTVTEYGPQVSGQWRNQWSDPSSGARGDHAWDASLSVDLPIFEGGQRELDLKNADYLIEQSRLKKETLRKSIQEEVWAAWLQAKTLRETLQTLSISVETADQTYRDVQAQYEAGASTSLDVLISLRDLNKAKTDFGVQTYDYQIALRELRRSTGDLGRGDLFTLDSTSHPTHP